MSTMKGSRSGDTPEGTKRLEEMHAVFVEAVDQDHADDQRGEGEGDDDLAGDGEGKGIRPITLANSTNMKIEKTKGKKRIPASPAVCRTVAGDEFIGHFCQRLPRGWERCARPEVPSDHQQGDQADDDHHP